MFDLTVIWAVIIAFAVFAYVVMDGFDLGIGIIFPALGRGAERDKAISHSMINRRGSKDSQLR